MVFLTSYADEETQARAKGAGPFGFLVKPFRPVNLCTTVEMALHKHDLERMLAAREALLNSLLHISDDVTLVVNQDGTIQFASRSADFLLKLRPEKFKLAGISSAVLSEIGNVADDFTFLSSRQPGTVKLPLGLMLRRGKGDKIAIEGQLSQSTAVFTSLFGMSHAATGTWRTINANKTSCSRGTWTPQSRRNWALFWESSLTRYAYSY